MFSCIFQAWLRIFGILGGPVLGLFSLGMFIPWASGKAAFISAVTSLLTLLWIAIGGNISRLNNFYTIPQLNLSDFGCANSCWNITKNFIDVSDTYTNTTDNINDSSLGWWIHLPIYDISYMWY